MLFGRVWQTVWHHHPDQCWVHTPSNPRLNVSFNSQDNSSGGVMDISMTSGLCHKHITIVNDDSRVIRMMLQAVASPTIGILTTLEASVIVILMTLESIYNAGVTYDRHLRSSKYFYSRGHRPNHPTFRANCNFYF